MKTSTAVILRQADLARTDGRKSQNASATARADTLSLRKVKLVVPVTESAYGEASLFSARLCHGGRNQLLPGFPVPIAQYGLLSTIERAEE
jgi:hypothetical protein